MDDDLCAALCQLDKAIDASMFLTLGGVALTLAVFLYTTATQLEDRHQSAPMQGFQVTPEARHSLEQLKMGLGKVLLAWWLCVIGVAYALTVDLSIVAPLIKQEDFAAHVGLLMDFQTAALANQLDAIASSTLLVLILAILSYGSWLIFPELRYILSMRSSRKGQH